MKENNCVSFVKCQLCLVSVMLKVTYKTFMLNVIMLNVTMLNVTMLNVNMPNVVILSVMVPFNSRKMKRFKTKQNLSFFNNAKMSWSY
jgi:hypothetical protein